MSAIDHGCSFNSILYWCASRETPGWCHPFYWFWRYVHCAWFKTICSFLLLKFNSTGIEVHCKKVQKYDNNWKQVTEIKVTNKHLTISRSVGVSLMDLELHSVSQILAAQCKSKSLATYEDGLLKMVTYKDGAVSYCRF